MTNIAPSSQSVTCVTYMGCENDTLLSRGSYIMSLNLLEDVMLYNIHPTTNFEQAHY